MENLMQINNIQEKLENLQNQLNEAKFKSGFYYAAWEDTDNPDDLSSYEHYETVADGLISSFELLDTVHDSAWVQDAKSQGEKVYKEKGYEAQEYHYNPNEE
jgi:hypothetical protein